MNIIQWECFYCGNINHIEMHSDPNAHYPSMVCDHCGEETEGCLCDSL